MRKPLNPEKSENLRPLRIVLAVLTVVLLILILDRLPTSRTLSTRTVKTESGEEVENNFYFMTGYVDAVEAILENRLEILGVPEDDYDKLGEYLGKDEIFELETKLTLASKLEGNYVEAEESELKKLTEIFDISPAYPFAVYRAEKIPSEYLSLADLLDEYKKTLNTVEDYDVIEE